MDKNRTSGLLGIMLIALLMLNLAGCSQAALTQAGQKPATQNGQTADAQRTITDMAGRSVKVPVTIKTAFSTSPVAAIMLYALCPNKMVGWNYDFQPGDKKFIAPKYQALPNLGGWYAKNTGSTEEILKIHPDVIIDMGDITKTEMSNADKIQKQLGIPVVLVQSDPISQMDKACQFLGGLLGEKARAQELADYCRQTAADVKAKASTIPKDKQVRVYYAEGPKGLQTEPDGSMHIETLNIVGGINVAQGVQRAGQAGQSPVSMEQVLSWNPDVIMAWGDSQGGYYHKILSDSGWKDIKAVQQHRVYQIPTAPFNWFDRPPSVNRIIGFKWLGNLLYPDIFNYNMVSEVKRFYGLFYHYNLTDDEAKALLAQPTGN
ncbi:ABC transporter substrate-binding protein [Desulfosporosinus sp. FKA]|uniref:ABC transporter substrate-binding protein n=1 Tax=Desulfosporosinus sp. FKA TaxID=1969834 RepID=UPI000B498FFC|nr:ABC transporter substrate-binding protein [Desulfosporosinus sp. FKA]